MLNRLSDTLDFQAQALSLRSERQRLIASNIANADTPGYSARESISRRRCARRPARCSRRARCRSATPGTSAAAAGVGGARGDGS